MMKYRLMRWAGHVACMVEKTVAYRVLVCGREGKRPLRKPMHMWEDETKMDLK
jgi:hypothetical protein